MRTIKFRGKTIDGEWIYGDLIKGIYKDYCYIIQKCTFQSSDNSFLKINNHFLVNPETVGQFTGLLDKNGMDIYEGDVCSFKGLDGMDRASAIEWHENTLTFYTHFGKLTNIIHEQSILEPKYKIKGGGIEIIGNIHDNPSLLTE